MTPVLFSIVGCILALCSEHDRSPSHRLTVSLGPCCTWQPVKRESTVILKREKKHTHTHKKNAIPLKLFGEHNKDQRLV